MTNTGRIASATGLALALSTFCSGAPYSVTDLGTLGGTVSEANGINASGQVVGWSSLPGGTFAFLYSDGAMHNLGTLGGTGSIAWGINDSGEIVGESMIVGGG